MKSMKTEDGIVVLVLTERDLLEGRTWAAHELDNYCFKNEVQHEIVDANIVMYIDAKYVRIIKEDISEFRRNLKT